MPLHPDLRRCSALRLFSPPPGPSASNLSGAFLPGAVFLMAVVLLSVPLLGQGEDPAEKGPAPVKLDPRPLGDTPTGSGGSSGGGNTGGGSSGGGNTGGGSTGPILTIPDGGIILDSQFPRLGDHAYVWVNRHTSASSVPGSTYSKSSKGGTNRVKRTSAGRYEVLLAGLGQPGGNVQVTAYGGSNEYCTVRGWGAQRANLRVVVDCYGPNGRFKDVRFSLLAVWPLKGAAKAAYAWADQAQKASYNPSSSYAWTSSGKKISIRRSATGRYAVTFPGLGSNPASSVQVTAYGGSHSCAVRRWRPRGNDPVAEVACTTWAGNPVDGRFSILALGAYGKGGHAVPDRPTSSAAYSPALAVNSRKAVSAKSTAPGTYSVTFTGLGGGSKAGGNVQVTSHGDARCLVRGWAATGPDFTVNVKCTGYDGRPWATAFGVLVLW